MIYEDNEQLRDYIKSVIDYKNINKNEFAEKMGTSRQNVYKLLNKHKLTFDFVGRACEALGYKLYIDFREEGKENEETGTSFLTALEKIADMKSILTEFEKKIEMENKNET